MKLRLTLENATGLPATATASIEFGARESLSIGRLPGLDWTLPDPSRLMSGRHCEIRRSPEAYLLYDLSTNGTFIDGNTNRLTSPHALQDGERLRVGAYLIRVELRNDGEPVRHDDLANSHSPPATEPLLRLTIESKPSAADQYPLTKTLDHQGVLRIGRDDSNDWTLPDRTGGISRNHCTIRFTDGAFVLQDTSSNGTFVNHSSDRINDRVSGSYPLCDKDLLLVGPYLIAVQITGLGNTPPDDTTTSGGTDQPAPAPVAVDPLPAQAAPVRPAGGARRGGDPALLLADLPPLALPPAERGTDGTPASVPAADDGMTLLARVAKTPPILSSEPVVTRIVAEAAPSPSPAAATDPTPPAQAATGDYVLASMARGLGLSPEDLDQTDAAALGERLGQLLLLITDEIRPLLALRNAAFEQPPGVRPGPAPSNPLSIMPTSEEALRVLFGPPRRAYLDSHQSFQTSLAELAEYFRQTDAAIRAAVQILANELAPEAIERAASAENRIGQLLSSRKARLWDLYVERWGSRQSLQPHRPVRSFVATFAGETARGDKGEEN